MMNQSIVFMFSGQGSQYYQMGKMLYECQPIFRDTMNRLDSFAKTAIGQSVLEYIYATDKHPADRFDNILFTHPAIFMTEYALAKLLMEKGLQPDYLLGASMGEFVALTVAGALSDEKAILTLIEQARLFEKYLQPGGMLAVLADIRLFYDTPAIHQNSELAAISFDSHFVISGKNHNISQIENFLQSRNTVFYRLPVEYGFHSSEINPIESQFKTLHERIFGKPAIPILSCAMAETICRIDNEYVWKVIRKPICFKETIEAFEFKNDAIFIDLGPSGTLASFLKYILKKEEQSRVFSVLTPFGNDEENLAVLQRIKPLPKKVAHNKENKMQAVVFPGQGSQRKGMGGTLFDEYPEMTASADQILGYSIKELCLTDPYERLGQTQYTQPALYVVNALSYMKHVADTGVTPGYLAGHSLGEYNALFAAGVFDFETGLKLVKKRGELMSQAQGGGMAAVVGLCEEDVLSVIHENNLNDISVANFNTPSQMVIAGPRDSVALTESLFTAKGAILFRMLNVSGAFHTLYMASAETAFGEYAEPLNFNSPKIPVLSNVYARPYDGLNMKSTLVKQITSPVRWTDCIRYMMGKGVSEFVEAGSGTILTGLINKIKIEASPLIIEEEIPEEILALSSELLPDDPCNALLSEMEFLSTSIYKNDVPDHGKGKQNRISPESLGSNDFKRDYHLKYAYVTGGMYMGVASMELVAKIGKAGMLGFYGTGGLDAVSVEKAILYLKKELDGYAYGINILGNPMEDVFIDLFLKHGIKHIEGGGVYPNFTGSGEIPFTGAQKRGGGRIGI